MIRDIPHGIQTLDQKFIVLNNSWTLYQPSYGAKDDWCCDESESYPINDHWCSNILKYEYVCATWHLYVKIRRYDNAAAHARQMLQF